MAWAVEQMVSRAVWRIVTPAEQRRKAEDAYAQAVAEVEDALEGPTAAERRRPSADRVADLVAMGADVIGGDHGDR